ncbi:TPA: abortive infection system toxin AbiGii family protein [Bacillus cereus]
MFANFENAFFKQNKINTGIAKEILDSLSDKLPEGFSYEDLGNGAVGITSTDRTITFKGLKIVIPQDLPKNFTPTNLRELLDFMYRIQRPLKLEKNEETRILLSNQEFKPDELIYFPFRENQLVEDGEWIIPPKPFSPPFELTLEGNGIAKEFLIQRQPYPDLQKSLFQSINQSPFETSYIIDEIEGQLEFNFKIDLDNINTVDEILENLKLYQACITGEIKLNGSVISIPTTPEARNENEIKSIEQTIIIWEKVLALQSKLNVDFKPNSKLETDEVILIEELYRTLIENKPFKEFIVMDEMSFTNYSGKNINELLEIEGLSFQFRELSTVRLLNVTLELPSIVGFFNLKAYDFIKTEKKLTLLVKPIENKGIFRSIIYFPSEQEAEAFELDLNEFYHAETISIL